MISRNIEKVSLLLRQLLGLPRVQEMPEEEAKKKYGSY